jgi:hypothetical protein
MRFIMPTEQEYILYYRHRIDIVLIQAAQATCPSARCAYEQLTRLYREILVDLERGKTERLSPAGAPGPVVARQGNADDIQAA